MNRETYTVSALRQLVMVEGWQAVFWMDGHHEAWPIHALGLGTTNVHACSSNALISNGAYAPEEQWEIFGLEYTLGDGWHIVQEGSNFCGLVPPGRTLEEWDEHGSCANTHPKVRAHEQVRPMAEDENPDALVTMQEYVRERLGLPLSDAEIAELDRQMEAYCLARGYPFVRGSQPAASAEGMP